MALELEQIQPWDGQSGTGAEVRGALNRNFEKLKNLSILAGMPIKDLFTSVDLLPRPGISGNNYLVGENLYVWSESVLDYVDIGSVKGQDGLDGIDGKDSKQVTTVAYDGTRPVLRLLTDGSGVSYPVPTFSKSDGSTTTIITEAATYTNAEALSSKVDKGGSDKTLKQVEDEIVQLAGDVSSKQRTNNSIILSDIVEYDTLYLHATGAKSSNSGFNAAYFKADYKKVYKVTDPSVIYSVLFFSGVPSAESFLGEYTTDGSGYIVPIPATKYVAINLNKIAYTGVLIDTYSPDSLKFELLMGLQFKKYVDASGAVLRNDSYDIVRIPVAQLTDYAIDRVYFTVSFFNGSTFISRSSGNNTLNKFKTPASCNNVILTFTINTGTANNYESLYCYQDATVTDSRVSVIERSANRLSDERIVASPANRNIIGSGTFYANKYVIDGQNGLITGATTQGCIVIPCNPETVYSRNINNQFGTAYNIVKFLKSDLTDCSIPSSPDLTFTTPPDCSYIAINGNSTNMTTLFHIEEGGVFMGYQKPIFTAKNNIFDSAPKAFVYSSGKNKYDKSTMYIPGYIIDSDTLSPFVSATGGMAIIYLPEGQYSISNFITDTLPKFAKAVVFSKYISQTNYTATRVVDKLFTIESGEVAVGITINIGTNSINDILQVESGSVTTPYEEYRKEASYPERFLPILNDDVIQEIATKLNLETASSDVKQLNTTSHLTNYRISLDNKDFRVYTPTPSAQYATTLPRIAAVGGPVAVWQHGDKRIFISEAGIDGIDTAYWAANAFNIEDKFPGLIAGSTISGIYVLPYKRTMTGASSNITDYRVIITTQQGQIYHNKPNRSVAGTDLPLAGDYLLFEESVIWDMPHRRLPSKTSDVFPYVKNPCLPETCYTTFHPVLNTDSGFTDPYGNGGFGISKSDRPRMYIPEYNNYTVSPFTTMGGVVIQNAKLVLGTYSNPTTKGGRCVVLESEDGREFKVVYEFIQQIRNFNTMNFSELSYSSGLKVVARRPTFPTSTYIPTELFDETAELQITNISNSDPAIVTTAAAHGFNASEIIRFKTDGSLDASLQFLVNDTATLSDYGNGKFFTAKKLTDTTFELHEYASANDNNLVCKHIHSINATKDGYLVGTGEEYYTGPGQYPESHFILIANGVATKLNSSELGITRTLGCVLLDDLDQTVFHASDSDVAGKEVVYVNGELFRGSSGLFKGKLADMNDRSKYATVLESTGMAFFFQRINGLYIYASADGYFGISEDANIFSISILDQVLSNFGGVDSMGRIVVSGAVIYKK